MPKELDCSSSPSDEILRAYGEFNCGDWYDCHETLEDLRIGSEDEPRWFSIRGCYRSPWPSCTGATATMAALSLCWPAG